jgi:hypothetical protein
MTTKLSTAEFDLLEEIRETGQCASRNDNIALKRLYRLYRMGLFKVVNTTPSTLQLTTLGSDRLDDELNDPDRITSVTWAYQPV